jgi:exopolyphosphatase/guanosine-5'-triphosphate,3'-diphosphate pyrophosphatase
VVNSPSVAVIDIGSNSIKVLVAGRGADGAIQPLLQRSLDARISAGISAAQPRLSEEGMARGVAAVRELLALAAPHSPSRTLLVATSAVRDAANGAEFRERVRAATGHEIRILTGEEEANGIGRGLATDPALAGLRDFHVFDLGGGSLECLTFRDRHVTAELSLRLGCVRLMERFVSDPAAPFSDASRTAVADFTARTLRESGFRFIPGAAAVGTGGTVTTVRAILGARQGHTLEQTPARVTVEELRRLLDDLAPLDLAARRAVPGLPPGRADVFPTALATFLAVAEVGGLAEFHHSVRNLRYGLAAELLASR